MKFCIHQKRAGKVELNESSRNEINSYDSYQRSFIKNNMFKNLIEIDKAYYLAWV